MRKWVALGLALVLAAAALAGCGRKGESSGDQDTFTFAMSGLYKPFNFQDENGDLVGFDVEIGSEIAARMGMEAKPVANPWDTLLMGLNAGKFDCIIGSMAITEERREQADFSRPYYRSGAQVFVAADNTEITTEEDIRDKKIGVVKNSTFRDAASEFTDQVTEYDSDLTALQDIGTGRLDAVITDQMVGLRVMKEGAMNIKDVGEPLWLDEMAIPVQKGNTQLLDKINQALEEIIEDGTYDRISEKWFGRSILGE